MLNQLRLDVKLGTVPIKSVLLVQTNGFSILIKSVFQFYICVNHMMLQELVLYVIKDMI